MEQEIIAGLVARGMSLPVAQGVVANMKAESNLQPGINEISPVVPGSRGGFGLNQWTGPRRVAYEQFAAERGKPLDDLQTQLDFTMFELQGPERAAYAALQGVQDPLEAARIYSSSFCAPAFRTWTSGWVMRLTLRACLCLTCRCLWASPDMARP